MLPALDAEVERLGAVHLLHAEVVFVQDLDHVEAEPAVPREVAHRVVGVEQAARYEDDLFTPGILPLQ